MVNRPPTLTGTHPSSSITNNNMSTHNNTHPRPGQFKGNNHQPHQHQQGKGCGCRIHNLIEDPRH
eukprot:5481248-Karenia_brevis.AAC.1